MSLGAVKNLLALQVQTVDLTNLYWQRILPFPQAPKKPVKAGKNAIVVMHSADRRIDRLTPPRGVGEKEVIYDLPVLVYATHSTQPDGGLNFGSLVDRIQVSFASMTPGNPTIIDPLTLAQSYITYVGEKMRIQHLPVFMTAALGRLAFRAIMTLEIREILTPA